MEHKGTVRLETERLVLRPLAPEDAEAVYRNWASDEEVTRYLTWQPHESAEASAAFIRRMTELCEAPSAYNWGIELKELGQVVGSISVVHAEEDIGALELGWALGRAWWGRGIMPEAAGRVLRFLFEEVGADRIVARHDVDNPKSGRVMQKIGMRHEGTLRASARNNRGIVDMEVYAILRRDFEEAAL